MMTDDPDISTMIACIHKLHHLKENSTTTHKSSAKTKYTSITGSVGLAVSCLIGVHRGLHLLEPHGCNAIKPVGEN